MVVMMVARELEEGAGLVKIIPMEMVAVEYHWLLLLDCPRRPLGRPPEDISSRRFTKTHGRALVQARYRRNLFLTPVWCSHIRAMGRLDVRDVGDVRVEGDRRVVPRDGAVFQGHIYSRRVAAEGQLRSTR